MISTVYFIFLFAGCLVAFTDWRQGIMWFLLAGALQDPVRKLMPGAPGWMVLAFTPLLLAICVGVFSSNQKTWARFSFAYPRIEKRLIFFQFSLLIAGLVLLAKHGFGAIFVGIIGLLGYLFPMVAVLVGFMYARSTGDILRFIRIYSVITAILLIGGLLEYLGVFPNWLAIGTEALETEWIRHVTGYIVQLNSGFFRSPDLLGWHAGLLVMFSLLMAAYKPNAGFRWLWLLLAIWGTVVLVISGRNKMIFMPPIFLSVVVIAYMYKGLANRAVTLVLSVALGLGLFFLLNQQLKLDEEYFDYLKFGTSGVTERVAIGGMTSMVSTYRQSGIFGEGLGSASTGARFGGATGIRTWQESGSSKLFVELGVLGLVAITLLGMAIVKALGRIFQLQPGKSSESLLFFGFLGIVVANSVSFLVSHQAYGDPFLVTLAGLLLGITLSAPRWTSIAGISR